MPKTTGRPEYGVVVAPVGDLGPSKWLEHQAARWFGFFAQPTSGETW
ncbi:hypothetical protein [Pseudoclavibacter sp. AY1F1]|nr:hypothetical protein [Pseudoclavibacter sp. AY1F1]